MVTLIRVFKIGIQVMSYFASKKSQCVCWKLAYVCQEGGYKAAENTTNQSLLG